VELQRANCKGQIEKLGACLVVATAALCSECAVSPRTCQSDIVSPSVVATFCGHAAGGDEMMDLLILWRGAPGWFYKKGNAGVGSGGFSHDFGGWTKGRVSQHRDYGDVTIGFDADFDAETVTIDDVVLRIDRFNTILVDAVDEPRSRQIASRRRTAPRLPLIGEPNVELARRSPELLDDLRCGVPMPPPPPMPQPPVITACEKLKSK
jgi:hypothetical protein